MNLNWTPDPFGKGVRDENDRPVASCPTRFAPLIAAAPAMFALLRKIEREGLSPPNLESVRQILRKTTI